MTAQDDYQKRWKEQQQAQKEWALFLQDTPAYVETRIERLLVDVNPSSSVTTMGIRSPRIHIHCEQCDGVRSFQCGSETLWCNERQYAFIAYTCRDCGYWTKTFGVLLVPEKENGSGLTAMKLGEFPPFGSHLAKRLRDMLSKPDLELYRKGLRTEREGHGIGAAAYFRRVVENQWKVLLSKLRDAAEKLGTPPEGLKIFDDALAQQQFSTAVDMLRDAIPPKLLILDGRNPLTLLYRPLSMQLHDMSDADCLQQAADIRLVLNALFDNIDRVLKDDEHLRGAVTRLQGG